MNQIKLWEKKVCLIAQGYSQQEGDNYDKTFATVTRLESIQILFKWMFLNGFIKFL